MTDTIIADGKNYFGLTGLAVAVLRVQSQVSKHISHPHDLTEIAHQHDFCELVIVTQGQAMHHLEGHDFAVAAGDVFLLQGQHRHYFYDRQNLDLINVMYDPNKLSLPEGELRKLPGYCALFMLEPTFRQKHKFASRLHLQRVGLGHVERLTEEMKTECTTQPAGWEVLVRAKLLELMVYLSRAYLQSDSTEAHALLRVGHVIGALENNYTKDWSLDDLVAMSHMSRSNLMQIFRKATGQPPIEYLLRLRLQKATELLRNPTLAMTDIAFEVGFNDSNYFTRQFKQVYQMTPRQFKKSLAK
jgi:AraC-like DNA-binding protein/mannose-6-phosphate isomerase-like protein (cupin superfamily)